MQTALSLKFSLGVYLTHTRCGRRIFRTYKIIYWATLGLSCLNSYRVEYNIKDIKAVNTLKAILNLIPSKTVYAHCDIPCGIYDPHGAQLAAKTVLTMVQKIKDIKAEPGSPEELQARNSFVRMVKVKEEHAELCKREVLILWTDYFKAEHLEKFPNLHELVWKTTKLCSDNKRAVDEAKAKELVEAVEKVAQMFADSKK